MKLSEIIKQNRVLIAGLILPLLLVILFTFAKTVPEKTVPAPEYKVVFLSQDWSYLGDTHIDVKKDGTVKAEFIRRDTYGNTPRSQLTKPNTTLHFYNPETDSVTETKIDFPDVDTLLKQEKTPITIPELKNLKFSDTTTAPDGYEFESYYYKNRNMLSDIFISSSRYYGPAIHKNGRTIKLAKNSKYIGDAQLIGWIIEDHSKE